MDPQRTGRLLLQNAKTTAKSIRALKVFFSSQRSPFLDLHSDLLFYICTFLSKGNQLLLSQTCSALRNSLSGSCGISTNLDREQRFEFLVGLAHDRPNHWVSDVCARLHRFVLKDLPGAPWHTTCPWGWVLLENLKTGTWPAGFEYRHVQMALKYDRMKRNHSYVDQILKPQGFQSCEDLFRVGWVLPKIVRNRFLVMVIHRMRIGPPDATRTSFDICWHQKFEREEDVQKREERSEKLLKHAELLNIAPRPEFRETLLQTLTNENRGLQFRGSCSLCTTDWFVCVTWSHILIYTWQDLGPEGSPLDPLWRANRAEFLRRSEVVGVGHEPGSIEKLYGDTPRLTSKDKELENSWAAEVFREQEEFLGLRTNMTKV